MTGITLARLLREKGHEVLVLEAESRIGGLCRSRTVRGFTFDTGGSHIIFSRDKEVLEFMHGVLGSNRDTRSRNTKILYRNILVKYPFENGLAALPKEDLYFCINEFIRTYVRAEKGEIPPPKNFREWIFATFGRGIAELYMIPYNEKIWNYPAHLMSAHWMEGRVPRPPVEDVIKSAIGVETEGYTHQSIFSYPVDGGIEALVTSIADGLEDAIFTGFPVRSLVFRDGHWEVSDGTRTVSGDRVISTIPLQHLVTCLHDIPDEVKNAVQALRYNSVACIQMGIRGTVPDISWLYIPDPNQGLANRISFPSNFSSHVAPGNHAGILAEITYNEGDAVSRMTDEELINHTVRSLGEMGFITPDQVVHTSVDRQKFAYVVYDLGYLENIRIIREYFKSRGITLEGRFSRFEYLNMDGCIRNAMECAKGWE
ncbi:MAG: hypothetical protein A4E42_00642 [Methanoregulaceae archaeon PtaU1.Bin222]|nr:MAG: hypothetical protein A4E42_00642 [Methanoregulaceae archaeon PtaU1.Bin222]